MTSSPPEIVKEVLAQRVTQTLADPSLTPAAILLVLYRKDGQYCVLLHKRSEQVEYHKGEISFPGGTQDQEDRDSLDTALRETEEEMGLRREDVTILGKLDEVATNSGFLIRVYVGTIEYPVWLDSMQIVSCRSNTRIHLVTFMAKICISGRK